MTNSSEAFQRIEGYFDEFCKGVDVCLMTDLFVRGDLLDAYGRLARLRDRFKAEKHNLNPAALAALSKVFEHDTFIKGMMHIRQVGEHVKKRGGQLVIWTTGNEPITLDAESSAMAVFSASPVTLTDIHGNPHPLDHLEMLREAEKRITNAMSKATQ
ncbi:MAG: hypothetical protein ACE5KF_11065, partial [Kiloniellaceae bacterium]